MNLNKKNIIIGILILIIFIILVVFLIVKNDNKAERGGIEQSKEVSALLDINDFSSRIKKDYKKSKTFQECLAMDMGLNSCLHSEIDRMVKDKNDPRYCNDFPKKEDIDNCIEQFNYRAAIKDGDLEKCNSLKNLKSSCLENIYVKMAIDNNEPKICEKIGVDDVLRNENINRCKNRVYNELAIKYLDEKFCEKISKPERDICKSEVNDLKKMKELEGGGDKK